MTLCPIAVVVGCQKCLFFKLCPVKGLLGDSPETPEPEVTLKPPAKPAAKARPATKPAVKSQTKRAVKPPIKPVVKTRPEVKPAIVKAPPVVKPRRAAVKKSVNAK